MHYFVSILIVLQCSLIIGITNGHGYLLDPPARSSAWLKDMSFRNCCEYFNHNEMFCGGRSHQWDVMDGKCSICGEAFDAKPKLFGRGGSMYLGKIVRTYTQGSIIPVTVVLTANHRGIFEFRVCNIDGFGNDDATQECLDLNLLQVNFETTRFPVQSNYATVIMNVSLPANLTCNHCVFQWKYVTGNSWGTYNGRSCLGCGRDNEEFYGCADIAILSDVQTIVDGTSSSSTTSSTPVSSTTKSSSTSSESTTTTSTTTTTTTKRTCRSAQTFSSSFDVSDVMNQYCQTICATDCATEKRLRDFDRLQKCRATCSNMCICA